MSTRVKTIILLSFAIFMISVVGVNAQMENLRADYDSKVALFDQAKLDYLKVKGLPSTDTKRLDGARNFLTTSLDSVIAYMNIFKSKLDLIKPQSGETLGSNLSDKYTALTALNKRVQDARTLDDFKTCLTDTKALWTEVIEECKYVQSRWMLYQTNEEYLKLNQVATELSTFVDTDELTKTKQTLASSNTDFTSYYTQMVKKSKTELNSSYSDIQQNILKYSKVLGDSETSLGNVIQSASK